MNPCDCGSGADFAACCGAILSGRSEASGPEALMRSRYTAYRRHDFDYLVRSTDPERRAKIDHDANREWALEAKFLKLEILDSSEQGTRGEVEFKATFESKGLVQVHHEHSVFRRLNRRWYFREGTPVD